METGPPPLRHPAFGTNAYVAHARGDAVVPQHTEIEDSGTEHEELYFVASGRARFTVGGEEIDAPAGTFVFVGDPTVVRSAVAEEAETAVLAFGATPGVAFAVSDWERKYTDG